MDEFTILKIVAALGVGLAVGGGLMILAIAKWGNKLFSGDKGDRGDRGDKGAPGNATCPFAGDHPKLQEFMGASMKDREDMRGFLEDINGKVGRMSGGLAKVEGKLDVLLQGARVRWNGAMPFQEKP